MNFFARLFCGHKWIIVGAFNVHRTSDNAVIGHRFLLQCEHCGKMKAQGFK